MNHKEAILNRESIQLDAANHIDSICDVFEKAWSQNDMPQIENFIDRCDPSNQPKLFAELLLVDHEFRKQAGNPLSRQDYTERFPQFSSITQNIDFSIVVASNNDEPKLLTTSPQPLAGTTLAHFKLLEELGAGASGTVWKAFDTRLQRAVALKLPRQQELGTSQREQFLREAQACGQLQHSNIVRVHESGDSSGIFFIVAEFIDGQDLRERLKQESPTASETTEMVAQLADALQHAHEQGVIHRDLKPANVLLDAENRPLITDFGLAKWTANSGMMTIEGHIFGTPAYMSPEQARGNAHSVDQRTDVYGLGTVLYEMLTGQPPFNGEVDQIIHQVISNEPRSPRKIDPTIPRDLESICLKAIEKEPNRRYATAMEFAQDLRRYGAGEAVTANPPSLARLALKSCRRRPSMAIAMGLAFTTLAGILTAAFAIGDRNMLEEKNRRLVGYQRIRIETEPAGAKIAIVSSQALEPNNITKPQDIIQAKGLTPLEIDLKPGEYLIEAALFSNGIATGLAEVKRVVPSPGSLAVAVKQLHWDYDIEKAAITLSPIYIINNQDQSMMTVVEFDADIREKNLDLPSKLIVDIQQTLPERSSHSSESVSNYFAYDSSVGQLEKEGKRLATASEYDAICEQVSRQKHPKVKGLFDEFPEWSSTLVTQPSTAIATVKMLSDVFILKGYRSDAKLDSYTRSHTDQIPGGPQLVQPRFKAQTNTAMRGIRSFQPNYIDY